MRTSYLKYIKQYRKQQAQAMVEFIIVFPVLMLLTLGTFQVALVYNAKTTVNYAIFNAARVGAVSNADKDNIERAFIRGLAPLFTSIDDENSTINVKQLQIGRDKVKEIVDDGFVCIQRLNPTNEAFLDFGKADDGMIPNNNLMYRSSEIGGASQVSIQDANLLKLRVTYCHELIVPFFPNMLKLMVSDADPDGLTIDTDNNLFIKNCYLNGRMPIVSQAIVRMQSDIKNDIFPSCTSPL
ncbi:MAG: pilus assembly protein [Gammaproteobacteria bacterium]|nr:pilus assembly protein [Gammaproteobacteria bacterium]